MGENNAKEEGLKFQFSLRYFDWNFLLKKILKSSTYCSRTPLHLLHTFQLKLFLSLLLNIHKRILLFIAKRISTHFSFSCRHILHLSSSLSVFLSLIYSYTLCLSLSLSLTDIHKLCITYTHTISLYLYISLYPYVSLSLTYTFSLSLSLSLYLYISVT